MKKIVKVGLVQMHCSSNLEENFKRAADCIKKLVRRGAQIICLPELFLSEYFCQSKNKKYFNLAESIPGPTTHALAKIAEENNVVVITSVFEKSPSKFYNTAIVLDADGRLVGKYRKMHIPDDTEHHYDEAHYFAEGNLGFKSFKTKYAAVGPMICFDQWFPEGARAAASKGAQILFYPTAIGFPREQRGPLNKAEHEAWQIIQRSHAIANGVFVVAVNRVGREQHLNFWGTSFVADPLGRILVKGPIDREANLIAECDLNLIYETRRDWPFLDACRVGAA